MTTPILPDLQLLNQDRYTLGMGIRSTSGSTTNVPVVIDVSPPLDAGGGVQALQFTQVSSTEELEKKLGIDVSASYGGFGVGASARFAFSQEAQVNSSSIFSTITASYTAATQSFNTVNLTPEAAALVDNPEAFNLRYGDMFLSSMESGGIFVGVYRIDCHDESTKTSVEADLQGSYGAFSAKAAVTMQNVATNKNVSIFCTLYSEGGPALSIANPNDPKELIDHANAWFAAINADPKGNSHPIRFLASPIAIASGPLRLNTADILNAADVLGGCYQERTHILDELNLFQLIIDAEPGTFQFTAPTTITTIESAFAAASTDLDTVHKAASLAMNDPVNACLPAQYAKLHGITYPSVTMPNPMPALSPGAAPPPPAPTVIATPNLMNMTVTQVQSFCDLQKIQFEDAFFSPAAPAVGSKGGSLGELRQGQVVFHAGTMVVVSPPHTDDQIVVVGQVNRPNDPFPMDGNTKMELEFNLAPGVH